MDIAEVRRSHREQITIEALDYDTHPELVCRRTDCVHVEGNGWSSVGIVSLGSVQGFTLEQIAGLRDRHVNGTD